MPVSIAVIMPAFRAETLIGEAVKSLFAQTFPEWRLYLVGDDETDYEALLGRAGLWDRRCRFIASGKVRGGASRARNIALDLVSEPYAAILDADDRMKPQKLAALAAALAEHPVVSTALDVMDDRYTHLRFVGVGPDRLLAAADYKFTCLSMDSMIGWDRRRCDARYEEGLPNLTDLDFLVKLWRTAPGSYHLGTPLHDYVKLSVSMSNGPGVTERMTRVKRLLIERLGRGDYPMQGPGAAEGLAGFLAISLHAEETYEAAMADRPGLLFEDHLEPMLSRL
jgi:glycosyltransferase involved in cell wall biosynthesis